MLEKKKFPREKYCGDAVCKTAIEILDEMGVYEELIRDNKARIVSWFFSSLNTMCVCVCACVCVCVSDYFMCMCVCASCVCRFVYVCV